MADVAFDPSQSFEPVPEEFDPNASFEPIGEPDMKPLEQGFKANIMAKREADKPAEGAAPKVGRGEMPIDPTQPHMQEADSFIEAIEAGFDMSVTGLLKQRPDMVLPQDSPMFYRIASQVAQLAGDVPAMIAGTIAGSAAGTMVAPGVGTVIGGGAGAFALPEGMRTWMMEGYEKGEVTSFADFWERASATAINSLKAGVVGGATVGVGGVVAKTLGKVAAPALAKTTAQLTAEVTTMTTIGAGLDGRVPEPHEFIDGAILVGFMHGSIKAATKMRRMYSKGGVEPVDVADKAMQNAKLKQELLSDNVEVPGRGEFGITVGEMKPPENFETVKPLREPKDPSLSAEVNTILGKVQERLEPTKLEKAAAAVKEIVNDPKGAAGETFNSFYTNFVDKLDPLNRATEALKGNKEAMPAEANPYILSRMSVDAKAKAKHFFEKGTLDYHTLEINGDPLSKTLRSIENPNILDAVMISKRALVKGEKSGFDLNAAKEVIKQHGKEYGAAAEKVTEFANKGIDYVTQAGLLSPEQNARMKAEPSYVPFKRIMTEADKQAGKRQGKAGSLKEFTGSERDVQKPITSLVENTVELIQAAEVNRPKLALVELAKQTEGQTLIREVKASVQKIEISKEEVARQLGISVEAAEPIVTFRAINKDLTPNQFAVMENGKRKVYETTPELAQALNSLGGDATSTNMLFKVMHGITVAKKFGITFTPDFIIKNLERDFLTAQTYTKGKAINPIDVLSAMGDIIKKNDSYYEWLKSGGANGAFIEMGNRYITNNIYKLQEKTNLFGSVRNLVQKPIDGMRVAAELAEQSLRLAEFKKVTKATGSRFEGGFASREITLDFQRVGAKLSALNAITAFQNVSIQGLDKTARAFKANPTGLATRAFAYITVPSLLLYWANYGDERVDEVPQWEKDNFWIIATDDWQEVTPSEADGLADFYVREEKGKTFVNKGKLYRMPKPQELGLIFGSLPERTLDLYFKDNPAAFKDFGKTLAHAVTPSFVPDAIAPPIEQYMNKSFFTGQDIVPNHLKKILPEYQFVEYTSETAKTLGSMVATIDKQSDFASPMNLDNYIRSWGGTLGQYAIQTLDKALVKTGVQPDNVDPTMKLEDLWFIKSFVTRFPRAGSASVQTFFDTYEENEKIQNTIRYLADQGDFENAEKELTLDANQDKLLDLKGIKEGLSAQSKLIRMIEKNPDMTPDEKRQMIDGAYMMMTEIAKQGNEIMREVKKELGE